MNESPRFAGLLQHLYAHWPSYVLLYSGIVAGLLWMGFSLQRGWLSFIPLTLAVLIVATYIWLATVWLAHQIYDRDGLRPYQVLFDMARLRHQDHFVYIELGTRVEAIALSNHLITGHITVIDIYNPQWTPSPALARWRQRVAPPAPDPRLTWLEGNNLTLLPLPDNSSSTVILCQVLSELWQEGDRLQLLREVHRILTENGRVLLAERVRSHTHWLVWGPMALTLAPARYWQTLLRQAGFQIRQEQDLKGIIHCFRADKPAAMRSQQLAFDFVNDT